RLPVVRHHLPVLRVVVAAGEIEVIQLQGHALLAGDGLEDLDRLRHDLLADAVTWYYCDLVSCHLGRNLRVPGWNGHAPRGAWVVAGNCTLRTGTPAGSAPGGAPPAVGPHCRLAVGRDRCRRATTRTGTAIR